MDIVSVPIALSIVTTVGVKFKDRKMIVQGNNTDNVEFYKFTI